MTPLSRAEIATKISALTSLTLEQLRNEWLRTFGAAAPATARQEYLARALAYQMQVATYGGLSPAATRRLKKLCGAYVEGPTHISATKTALTPGTRILREWKGKMHEAIVVEHGFLYDGETYKSLSVIARKITGTRWSGPAFFGLRDSSTVPITSASEANAILAEERNGN